jgi:hypothetical protein
MSSTCLISDDDSVDAQFWTFKVTDPSAAAAMAVEVSSLDVMSTLPHGFAVLGRWTSLRWGVPLTPRAGLERCAR